MTDGHLTGKFPQRPGGTTFTVAPTPAVNRSRVNQTFTITKVNPFTIPPHRYPKHALGSPYDSQLTQAQRWNAPPSHGNANTPAGPTITNTGLIQGTTTDGTPNHDTDSDRRQRSHRPPATLQPDTECGPNTSTSPHHNQRSLRSGPTTTSHTSTFK